jgi:hypothetical protein
MTNDEILYNVVSGFAFLGMNLIGPASELIFDID